MKGIIFDLDGTLIDSTGIWHDIDVEFLARHGRKPTPEYFRFVGNNPLRVCADFTIEYYSLTETADEVIAQWLHMSDDKYRQEIQLKHFVREFLAQCRDDGIRMSIATSCTAVHCHDVLERTGICEYFDCISLVEEIGKTKEFPDVYLHAAAGMGLSSRECTVFEDAQNIIDVVRDAGFKLVGVYDKHTHQDELRLRCDRFIASFEELIKK